MLLAVIILEPSIVTPSLEGQPEIWEQRDDIIAKGRFFYVYLLFHFVGHIFSQVCILDIASYFLSKSGR